VGTDVVTSPGAYRVLGAYMAVTVVTDAIPVAIATRTLEAVNFPPRHRWVFPPVKAAAAFMAIFAAMTVKGPSVRA
jgi:hypothetical protein